MPQMAPLNWLMLFLYFTVIFLFINSLNYSVFNYKIKTPQYFLKKVKLNWKW